MTLSMSLNYPEFQFPTLLNEELHKTYSESHSQVSGRHLIQPGEEKLRKTGSNENSAIKKKQVRCWERFMNLTMTYGKALRCAPISTNHIVEELLCIGHIPWSFPS